MKNSIIKQINIDFKNDILPNEFNYNIENKNSNIDVYKLWYNEHYKSNEYIREKLLPDSENSFLNVIINEMSKLVLSPLEEMINRRNKM